MYWGGKRHIQRIGYIDAIHEYAAQHCVCNIFRDAPCNISNLRDFSFSALYIGNVVIGIPNPVKRSISWSIGARMSPTPLLV